MKKSLKDPQPSSKAEVPAPKKEWKDYSKQEKRNGYVAMATIAMFVLFWASSGFRSAVAMVLLGYAIYLMVSAVRRSGFRKKNGITAAILFVLMAVIIPQAPVDTAELQSAAAIRSQAQATEASQKAEQERLRKLEASKPKVKVETKAEAVAFESIERNDATIPLGERRVSVEGIDGQRTLTYDVTYVNGAETERKEIKNEVTKQPTAKVTLVGTYVKPQAPAPASSSSGSGYTNSQGNHVASPSSNPEGASAKCNDGTYSYSQSRRGTCSHHGGVAVWL